MENAMSKFRTKPVLSILALSVSALGLAACGLTGPLDRPDPIIGQPEAKPVVAEAPTEAKPAPRPTTNAVGGELPAAAPVDSVGEDGLPPVKKDDGN